MPWNWEPVREKLQELIQDIDVNQFVTEYAPTSKINADHSKLITKNKSYQAPWTSRFCDLLKNMRKDMDSDNHLKDGTKAFINHCQTTKPQS